jgi:hypothetical protein
VSAIGSRRHGVNKCLFDSDCSSTCHRRIALVPPDGGVASGERFQTTSFPQPLPPTTIQSLELRFRAENTTKIGNGKCARSAHSITCDAARKRNVDSMSHQRKASGSANNIQPEPVAVSTRVAARSRVSRNRKQRVAEPQETGMSRSWVCQSFTRPKSTRHWLCPKKPEMNCSKS